MKTLKRLTFALGILAGAVSIGMGAMSYDEWERAKHNCFENEDKSACQALINDDSPNVEQCDKSLCGIVGAVYFKAGRYKEAIPYYEKAIALGDDRVLVLLGDAYYKLADNFNAKKYWEIACNKGNGDLAQSEPCYNLGLMYYNGEGVRQNHYKAYELWKKACDMKNTNACNNLGVLYRKGQGVRQNISTAKQYFGKACDLGNQIACNNYKELHSVGVQ